VEFASVVIHLTKKLLSWHRLGVHYVGNDLAAHLFVSLLKSLPDGSFATSRRTHNNDSHSLLGCFLELKYLLNLLFYWLQFVLSNRLVYGCGQLFVCDVF